MTEQNADCRDGLMLPFACCEHCGCGEPDGYWKERLGHDDTCSEGCNDRPQSGSSNAS